MKITILALHLGYGGIEKFISNIANMFAEENEVEIISIYKLYEKPAFYINPKVKITYLLENLKPNRKEFYSSIKKLNVFEIIKQAYIAIKILYLKKHKMKNAIKLLSSNIAISTIASHNKLLSKYGNKNIKKIATEHNYNAINTSYIKKVANSCKKIDYLVVASKELANVYKSCVKNCKVINIPLSLDYIPSKVSNLESKEITYIGRLSEEKGVLDLIEVFNLVHKQDKSIRLNVIGDGNKKEEMLSKIKEYKLEDSVIMHGFKNKEEIEEILLNTSIGINTSYTESFGLAVLETFSYRIPVVAFDSAEGLLEVIENNKNGYLIANRDFQDMANKMINLIDDKEIKIRLGESARSKSMEYAQEEIKKYWKKLL